MVVEHNTPRPPAELLAHERCHQLPQASKCLKTDMPLLTEPLANPDMR